MLELNVKVSEEYDETSSKFIPENFVVRLEHSLVTVSKWESFWEIPFLGDKPKTTDQTLSYIQMMVQDEDLPLEVFDNLIQNHVEAIQQYIGAKMTATTVPESPDSPGRKETITSELIYYWMVSMNIPFECERWHLNRLIMLIRVVGFKNKPKDKQRRMTMAQRQALNQQRQAQYNTRG